MGFPKFDIVIYNLKNVRILFFPLGILYGCIMAIRNGLFNLRILSSKNPTIKSIGIGNLAMGGTGKSVVVMYLIKMLKDHSVATLSRGYGRKTNGLIIAGSKDTPSTLGDEPYQFFNRYPATLVMVSEKRTLGIKVLEKLDTPPDWVILDDVMQHRWIRPHIMIMTSSFQQPYFRDFVFPAGGLREFSSGVKRADILLITRSPHNLSLSQKNEFLKKINFNIPVFFTKIYYSDVLTRQDKTIKSSVLNDEDFLLVTGIADSYHLVTHLNEQYGEFDHLVFKDHHPYSKSDGELINDRAGDKIILTTEKDYAKLEQTLDNDRLYCITIELDFVFEEEQDLFKSIIKGI